MTFIFFSSSFENPLGGFYRGVVGVFGFGNMNWLYFTIVVLQQYQQYP